MKTVISIYHITCTDYLLLSNYLLNYLNNAECKKMENITLSSFKCYPTDRLFKNKNISKAIEVSMKYRHRQIIAFPLNEYMK